MKPLIIQGIAEDAASAKSWLLGIEHEITCAKGGSGRTLSSEQSFMLQHIQIYSSMGSSIFSKGNNWGTAFLFPCTDLNDFGETREVSPETLENLAVGSFSPCPLKAHRVSVHVSERLSCRTLDYRQSSVVQENSCTRREKSFVSLDLDTCSTRTRLYGETVSELTWGIRFQNLQRLPYALKEGNLFYWLFGSSSLCSLAKMY